MKSDPAERADFSAQLEQLVPNHKEFMELAQKRRRIYRHPTVLASDSSCVIAGLPHPQTPILVDAYGDILDEPSKWLIYLRTMNTARGSVLQYASAKSSFWRYLQHTARKHWDQVTDQLLLEWRNSMVAGVDRKSLEKRKRTVNRKLYVVLEFYRWCQEQGYVQNIIGLTPEGKPPFPIRLVQVVFRNQARITSPLLYKTRHPMLLPVPTQEEIDSLYVHLSGPSPVKARDVLLARWPLDSGLRETEVLGLRVSDIPSLSKCQSLKDQNRLYWMEIIGKGGVARPVPVSADVLLETHAFIRGTKAHPSPRELMLKQRKKSSEEDKIFLSATTGEPLHRQSLSHIFSRVFLIVTGRKDRRGLHYHRLRARFASKLVQELAMQALEAGRSIYESSEQQLILEKVARILGHQDIKTLRYYLNAFIDQHDEAVVAAGRQSRGVVKPAMPLLPQTT